MVTDPTCWADLRTYKDKVYDSFEEAARARDLMEDSEMWINTIEEVFREKTTIAKRIRWLAMFFATANLKNPKEILDRLLRLPQHWLVGTSVAGKSYLHRQQYVLRNLEWFLRHQGIQTDYLVRDDGTYESACERIGLPRPEDFYMDKNLHIEVTFPFFAYLYMFFSWNLIWMKFSTEMLTLNCLTRICNRDNSATWICIMLTHNQAMSSVNSFLI